VLRSLPLTRLLKAGTYEEYPFVRVPKPWQILCNLRVIWDEKSIKWLFLLAMVGILIYTVGNSGNQWKIVD
jgi:hypothetical protein